MTVRAFSARLSVGTKLGMVVERETGAVVIRDLVANLTDIVG